MDKKIMDEMSERYITHIRDENIRLVCSLRISEFLENLSIHYPGLISRSNTFNLSSEEHLMVIIGISIIILMCVHHLNLDSKHLLQHLLSYRKRPINLEPREHYGSAERQFIINNFKEYYIDGLLKTKIINLKTSREGYYTSLVIMKIGTNPS